MRTHSHTHADVCSHVCTCVYARVYMYKYVCMCERECKPAVGVVSENCRRAAHNTGCCLVVSGVSPSALLPKCFSAFRCHSGTQHFALDFHHQPDRELQPSPLWEFHCGVPRRYQNQRFANCVVLDTGGESPKSTHRSLQLLTGHSPLTWGLDVMAQGIGWGLPTPSH